MDNKYIKYKRKYLDIKNKINELKGGLIGTIDVNKLDSMKQDEEVPEKIVEYVKMMTIPGTEVIRVGSSMYKIQPFYSDVDVMNIVSNQMNPENLVKFFIENLKKLITKITQTPNTFFSDFKAGGLHWTAEQIFNEKNGELSLYDACFIKDVIKLDIIAPYNERYVEMSTFYILKSIGGYVNVSKDYFENFQKSLLDDIHHYKDTKPFKAIKRIWSLARLNKDNVTLQKLYELVKSNVALLSQINADIETIILLLEHNSNFDVKFTLTELDAFKEKVSSILDISIDFQKFDLMIDNVKLLLVFYNLNEGVKNNIIESLTKTHDYLLEIINKETIEYIKSINYTFPTSLESMINSDKKDIEIIQALVV